MKVKFLVKTKNMLLKTLRLFIPNKHHHKISFLISQTFLSKTLTIKKIKLLLDYFKKFIYISSKKDSIKKIKPLLDYLKIIYISSKKDAIKGEQIIQRK